MSLNHKSLIEKHPGHHDPISGPVILRNPHGLFVNGSNDRGKRDSYIQEAASELTVVDEDSLGCGGGGESADHGFQFGYLSKGSI